MTVRRFYEGGLTGLLIEGEKRFARLWFSRRRPWGIVVEQKGRTIMRVAYGFGTCRPPGGSFRFFAFGPVGIMIGRKATEF